MELALICAQQVIVLFLLIGAGAAAIKTGVLKPEGRQTLSNLLVYLVVPAMIVHSYMMDFSEEILHNLLAAFGLSVLAILIATGDLKQIVCDRHIWKLAGLRMLVIPAVCLAAFAALGLLRFGMSAQVVLLLECCPAAAITSVFAVQFGHDEQFAAGCVVLTTLLSIVTLPLCALVLTALM